MPSPTLPGPRPENQRKRRELQGPRQGLIGLLALTALLALAGGVTLIARPDGRLLRLSRELLADSPLASFRSVGVVAVVLGGAQAIGAFLLLRHHVRARMAALIVALLTASWGLVQMMLFDVTWFQLGVFGVGALEVFLVAGCTPRTDPGRKKHRRGR